MVVPISDINPTYRRPYVTILLIAANIAVFVLFNVRLEGCAEARFIYEFAAVPYEVLRFEQLPAATLDACLLPVAAGKSVLLSVLSSMFLHGDLLHLGFNMLFLWVFGNNVEDRLGHVRYLLYYLVGGAIAVYAFSILHANSGVPLLGASGAIAAVLGGYLLMFPRARVTTYVPFPLYLVALLIPSAELRGLFFIFAIVILPAYLVLGFWFVSQLLSLGESGSAGVAFEAHIAGFLAGAIFTVALGAHRRRQSPVV